METWKTKISSTMINISMDFFSVSKPSNFEVNKWKRITRMPYSWRTMILLALLYCLLEAVAWFQSYADWSKPEEDFLNAGDPKTPEGTIN